MKITTYEVFEQSGAPSTLHPNAKAAFDESERIIRPRLLDAKWIGATVGVNEITISGKPSTLVDTLVRSGSLAAAVALFIEEGRASVTVRRIRTLVMNAIGAAEIMTHCTLPAAAPEVPNPALVAPAASPDFTDLHPGE